MNQVGEAIARYHKLIESEPYIDLAWAKALQERIKAEKLGDRPISPVLRPHFITNRSIQVLVKASESLLSAIARVEKMALANPALLARMQLLPAERMLAAVDPGYSFFSVTGLLDSNLNNGTMRFCLARCGRARRRGVRRRAGGSVLRSAAGKRIPQKI